MNGLQLIATGGALPGRTVTNEDLSRVVDTSDEWITTRTGIRTRPRTRPRAWPVRYSVRWACPKTARPWT